MFGISLLQFVTLKKTKITVWRNLKPIYSIEVGVSNYEFVLLNMNPLDFIYLLTWSVGPHQNSSILHADNQYPLTVTNFNHQKIFDRSLHMRWWARALLLQELRIWTAPEFDTRHFRTSANPCTNSATAWWSPSPLLFWAASFSLSLLFSMWFGCRSFECPI